MSIRFFFVLVVSCLFCQANAQTCHVKVIVKGVKTAQGKVRMGVYTDGPDFFKKPVKDGYIIIKNTKDSFQFEFDIPYGDYAIAIYHDIDDNLDLNRNLFGFPSEPYGFTRTLKGLSMPTFENLRESLKSPNKTLEVSLDTVF